MFRHPRQPNLSTWMQLPCPTKLHAPRISSIIQYAIWKHHPYIHRYFSQHWTVPYLLFQSTSPFHQQTFKKHQHSTQSSPLSPSPRKSTLCPPHSSSPVSSFSWSGRWNKRRWGVRWREQSRLLFPLPVRGAVNGVWGRERGEKAYSRDRYRIASPAISVFAIFSCSEAIEGARRRHAI